MAAATRITQQQVDGLGTLRELIDLIADKDKVVEAQEVLRQQMELTDDQQKKVEEARAFYVKYDADQEAIFVAAADLADKVSEHRARVEEDLRNIRNELDNIAAKAQELSSRESAVSEKERAQAIAVGALANDRRAMEEDYDNMLKRAQSEADDNERTRKANEARFLELKEFEEALRKKAANMAAVFEGK